MPPKYFSKHRQPQNEAIVPFSLKKPIELRPAIVGVGDRTRGQICLYELSLLLACFKQTSFSQIACADEIGNFQKCYYGAKKVIQGDNSKKKQGKSTTKEEINKLLKKYCNK